MQKLDKEQYVDWRSHPVTLALMEAIRRRVEEGKNYLVNSNDPDFDRITKGMLRAYNEILDHKADFSDLMQLLEEVAEGDQE